MALSHLGSAFGRPSPQVSGCVALHHVDEHPGLQVHQAGCEEARPVARVAAELGVCWWTVMNAVIEHGTPLVDDPGRVGVVTQLGVDETSFLSANGSHRTLYGTPTAEVQNTAADGQYLELASTAPYQISQTVQPLPGQDYVFSFRAKARQGFPSPFLARLTKPNGVVVEYGIKPGP